MYHFSFGMGMKLEVKQIPISFPCSGWHVVLRLGTVLPQEHRNDQYQHLTYALVGGLSFHIIKKKKPQSN